MIMNLLRSQVWSQFWGKTQKLPNAYNTYKLQASPFSPQPQLTLIEGLNIACIQKARIKMGFEFNDFTKGLKEKWPFNGHFSLNSFVKTCKFNTDTSTISFVWFDSLRTHQQSFS